MSVSVRLFDLDFFADSFAAAVALLCSQVRSTEKHVPPLFVCTPNPEQIILARQQPDFFSSLRQADLLLPDGMGLVLANRLLGGDVTFVERIAGVDVVSSLLEQVPSTQSIIILGGKNYAGALLPFGWRLRAIEEGIVTNEKVVYWLEGYRDSMQPTLAEEEHIRQVLLTHRPSIVFIALGAPAQEHCMFFYRDTFIACETRLVMAVGGSFDSLIGRVPRAPMLVQSIGMEWLYRLIREPWRWKRQLRLISFLLLVVKTLFRRVFFA